MPRSPRLALFILSAAGLAFALSQTLVIPALPTLQRQYDAEPSEAAWLFTGLLLSAAVTTPIAGRLGDLYGKRRFLLASLAIFALGCTVSALGDSLPVLVGGRVIAGFGAGVVPLAIGLIRDAIPREQVAMGIGLVSSMFGIGSGLGLLGAGVLIDHGAVDWVFGAVVPVTALVMWGVVRWVPATRPKGSPRVDWLGAGLLSIALLALLLCVSRGREWGIASPRVLALLGTLAVTGALWAWWERRAVEPIVDLELMRRRAVWTTNTVTFTTSFGIMGSFLIIPQLVQADPSSGYGFGASVTASGLFMFPHAVMMLVGGALGGALGTRFGSKTSLGLGSAVLLSAYGWVALHHSEALEIYLTTALMGFGSGLVMASMTNLIVEAVAHRQSAAALGINSIMRMTGAAVGAQVAAAILEPASGQALPAPSAFTVAFAVSAAITLVSVAVQLRIPARAHHAPEGDARESDPRPHEAHAERTKPCSDFG